MNKQIKENEKLTIHQLFWYFLLFSIVGIIVETLYCYLTQGIWESRKGLIWGPFCPVYGVGATLLILFLHRYRNKNTLQLFMYGIIVGSIAEYILSFGLEAIYSIRFWEYGYLEFNLNGRISLVYSVYWGILSVLLVKFIKPALDKIINRIKYKNILEILIFAFLTIDCLCTIWGIQVYQNRVLYNKVNNEPSDNILIEIKQHIENEYFTNERMSKTFPNLRAKDENGNEIWIKSLINGF